MQQKTPSMIRVLKSEPGYCKLENDSLLVLRVAVIDVRATQTGSPFGVEFEIDFTSGVSSRSPPEVLEKFKDKRVLLRGETPPSNWQRIGIVEKKPTVEEVEYEDEEVGRYIIRVELEPMMVSINTEVKTVRGEPYYVVRWAPKVSWRKVEEKD